MWRKGLKESRHLVYVKNFIWGSLEKAPTIAINMPRWVTFRGSIYCGATRLNLPLQYHKFKVIRGVLLRIYVSIQTISTPWVVSKIRRNRQILHWYALGLSYDYCGLLDPGTTLYFMTPYMDDKLDISLEHLLSLFMYLLSLISLFFSMSL